MSWEYRFLKRELAIPADPLLGMFEDFCERAYDAMASMEWSWKLQGEDSLANRVFWLGSPDRREQTSDHLQWLARELAFEPVDLPGGLAAWHDLLDNHTDRALVSYAGPNPVSGRPAAIKMYLTLDLDDAATASLLRAVMPKLTSDPPLEKATVLLCYAAYEVGGSRSRIYLIYPQEAFEDAAVAGWLAALVGPHALQLARTHPRAGIALKSDTTDMLGLGLRPSEAALTDHPSWSNSPALNPLFYAAGCQPLLRDRLHRVSWITVPLDAEALSFPMIMPEMNVYVRLLN